VETVDGKLFIQLSSLRKILFPYPKQFVKKQKEETSCGIGIWNSDDARGCPLTFILSPVGRGTGRGVKGFRGVSPLNILLTLLLPPTFLTLTFYLPLPDFQLTFPYLLFPSFFIPILSPFLVQDL